MSEILTIVIPDIGDFDAVPIIEILAKVGDELNAEDGLLTLESDKATMDVPSPAAGKLRSLSVKVGDSVKQGDAIATLELPPPSRATAAPTDNAPTDNLPADNAPTDNLPADNLPADNLPAEGRSRTAPPIAAPPVQKSGIGIIYASPSIRRYARELGADLSQVRGSAAKGRILKEDVKAWINAQLSHANGIEKQGIEKQALEKQSGGGIPSIPEVDFSEFGAIELEAFSRIQKVSAPHLHRAWLNIPHVTHHDTADITDTEAFRKSLKLDYAAQDTRITLLSFIMQAVVAGLKKFPHFNASLSTDDAGAANGFILKKYFHIGVAVDTPSGLMVPVIRDVDSLSIVEISQALSAISSRARAGQLKSHELKGGCISISSLGGIGGSAFTPIVNAPEVAILGITRAKMQPLWNGSEFVPRLMLPLDLSYDHRAIDGAQAARFMAHLVSLLADVRRLLL